MKITKNLFGMIESFLFSRAVFLCWSLVTIVVPSSIWMFIDTNHMEDTLINDKQTTTVLWFDDFQTLVPYMEVWQQEVLLSLVITFVLVVITGSGVFISRLLTPVDQGKPVYVWLSKSGTRRSS